MRTKHLLLVFDIIFAQIKSHKIRKVPHYMFYLYIRSEYTCRHGLLNSLVLSITYYRITIQVYILPYFQFHAGGHFCWIYRMIFKHMCNCIIDNFSLLFPKTTYLQSSPTSEHRRHNARNKSSNIWPPKNFGSLTRKSSDQPLSFLFTIFYFINF